MTTPPKDAIDTWGGTGLRPINPNNGVINLILIQFTLYPSGIGSQPNVKFAIARQARGKVWQSNGLAPPVLKAEKKFIRDEEVNDDGDPNDPNNEGDESPAPTTANHIYVEDAPGTDYEAFDEFLVWRMNYWEFVRVRFDGVKPSGDTPDGNGHGSRCSNKYSWHVRHNLFKDGIKWSRAGGDDPETDENDIEPDPVTIGDEP
jgi:hypothetical protein